MKGLIVFLCVAIAASSATPNLKQIIEKSIIDDAIALLTCINTQVANIEAAIAGVKTSVAGFQNVVGGTSGRFDECSLIGGDNPSISDELLRAQCVLETAAAIRDDIVASVDNIVANVNGILSGANNLLLCL